MQTQRARKNLRDALSHLRMQVGDYLLVDTQKLSFTHLMPFQSDVAEFQRQVETGRQIDDLVTVEKGLELYQDKFLAGFHVLDAPTFDSWMLWQREALHSCALTAMEWGALRHLQQRSYETGIELARRLLELVPYQESVQQLLMELYALSGRRAAAVQQYELYRQRLQSESGLLPSPKTERLYSQIKADQVRPAPLADWSNGKLPPSSPATASLHRRHNLPTARTPLVGRAELIATLCNLLREQKQPLITVVGVGGSGKTRIALAAAQGLITALPTSRPGAAHEPAALYHDGIWFFDLNGVAAPEDSAQANDAIAAGLGSILQLSFTNTQSKDQQLRYYLRDKAMLLILDSFEHLYAGRLFLVALLQEAPALQVVVTSRRRLGLSVEYLVEVPGLTVPQSPPLVPAKSSLTPEQLLEYSALQLFCICAQRVQHNFQLTAANAEAVVTICRLLDGLPLGLELAASQLTIYNLAALAACLLDDEQVLTSEHADLPSRQQKLHNVLATTWAMLTPDEAAVLAQATLLQKSFSLEALQFVTGANSQQVRQFVQLTLLHYNSTTAQFNWQPLVRDYAATQLALAPQHAAAAAQRHAIYYMTWLQQQTKRFIANPPQLEQVQRHWENISAAWTWSIEAEQLDLLASGVQAFATIYRHFGLVETSAAPIQAALKLAQRRLNHDGSHIVQQTLVDLLTPHGLTTLASEAAS